MSTINRKAQGFSIPTAIFLIVILAALGAFMVTIGGSQQAGLAQDVISTRALLAARSGLDWGIYQIVNTPGGAGTFRGNCNVGTPTTTLSNLNGMQNIFIVVECSSRAYNEGATALRSYQIVATACNNANCPNIVSPSSQYVERRLTALVVN